MHLGAQCHVIIIIIIIIIIYNYIINYLLEGKCHPQFIPILFGGKLIALNKKTGGIRPIAVGYTIRIIAAKCANTYAIKKVESFLSPKQVGVGVPGGCEEAVYIR